jgi:2,5-diketo-D-gluconate reductase A
VPQTAVSRQTYTCRMTTRTGVRRYRWIIAGGRGIDSAWSYDHGGYGLSQRQMGTAIKQSGVPRSELFITTKIPVSSNVSAADGTIEYDLAQLMVAQVDLLLIHTPGKSSRDIATTWSAMEAALAAGKTRAIGVSNFVTSNLETLLATARVVPAVNQISFSVGKVDNATVRYCKSKGIAIEAYSPLGHTGAPVLENEAVKRIASAHSKSPAAVALRYIVQSGHSFVTASGHIDYDKEDLDLFDWSLTTSEMQTLDSQ